MKIQDIKNQSGKVVLCIPQLLQIKGGTGDSTEVLIIDDADTV